MISDEYRPLDTLLPDSANYNRHAPEDIATLAGQIQAVGFTAPFLVDASTGLIAGGHLRRLALLKLRGDSHAEPAGVQPGWMVPCRVGEWSELQRLKVLIGDNPDPKRLDYDATALTALLSELSNQGELLGSGYDEGRLEELIAGLGVPSGDDWGAALGGLPNGDKAPFQQMTFTLSDAQAERVKAALAEAKNRGDFDGADNENSNGNALACICEAYLDGFSEGPDTAADHAARSGRGGEAVALQRNGGEQLADPHGGVPSRAARRGHAVRAVA